MNEHSLLFVVGLGLVVAGILLCTFVWCVDAISGTPTLEVPDYIPESGS